MKQAKQASATYNPSGLIDGLIDKLHLKNDAALCRAMNIAPPVVSNIRHNRLPVGASFLLRAHEVSGVPVRELRAMMGDRRDKVRFSPQEGQTPKKAA